MEHTTSQTIEEQLIAQEKYNLVKKKLKKAFFTIDSTKMG